MAGTAQLRHEPLSLVVLWMTAGSLMLLWVPILNGVVAGAVGGWMAGHVGRATLAAAISAVLATAATAFAFYGFRLDPGNLWSGLSLWGWGAVTFAGLLLGAIPAAITRRYGSTRDLLPAEAEQLRARHLVL